jgi:hypothetical protein
MITGNVPGGQLTTTTEVENFPGFINGIDGNLLMDNMKQQSERFGLDIVVDNVISVNFDNQPFIINTTSNTYETKSIIISTGSSAKYLGLDSEKYYLSNGGGVSTCATCDGFFSPNGVAGLVFYGSILAGVVLEIGLGYEITNSFTIAIFVVLPLLVILFHAPLDSMMHKAKYKPHEGWTGYIVEGFFELIEVILSFLTNTMSFLRVGGFVLSHAGMMLVVMTLHEMTGSFGIIVVILGNIFVIGLEGLIVGIQSLRLEYNEMFSRYFAGGGKKYIPTTLLNND